jgi:hypothetical protein
MAVTRLAGGLSPGAGGDPRTFPQIWNATADVIDDLGVGFRLVGTRYYTANGTFDKADPFDDGNPSGVVVRAVRVRVQAGGGGSGSSRATTSTQGSASSGGAGGGYAESFILASALTASVDVVVGAGGAGGAAPDTAGSNGGASSFGSGEAFEVSAVGGAGGDSSIARATPTVPASPSTGGAGGVGDLIIRGAGSSAPIVMGPEGVSSGGGRSFLSPGRDTPRFTSGSAGAVGELFGGGARGSINCNNQGSARNGSAGAAGIVIVEVFA